MDSLTKQLEEIHLLTCSLLPGEHFSLALPPEDEKEWAELIQLYPETTEVPDSLPSSSCRFKVKVDNVPVYFEFELPKDYPLSARPLIYVRGDNIDRTEQEELQKLVLAGRNEYDDSEFPVFNIISELLLHAMHARSKDVIAEENPSTLRQPEITYHALFTSHHLVSPTKRRNLQKWASELSILGFSKVGYPGCIYGEGSQANVEEFVSNVKAMQWLALRVRFVEPLPPSLGRPAVRGGTYHADRRWVEFEKVGEVVNYMRNVGRTDFVTEMGLGSSGST